MREESAWLLSYEDYDYDTRIVRALRSAYAAERDADARTSIEDSLGSADPDFVAPDALDLSENDEPDALADADARQP